MEIKDGVHKDFEKTQKWGPARKMLEKMGWKEAMGMM